MITLHIRPVDLAIVICIHSAIIQLLLTRRVKTRMDGVGIVFEFYIAPLSCSITKSHKGIK